MINNKKRKMEVSELYNRQLVLGRHHCLNSEWERLYYDYLNNHNIELQYCNKNLLKHIKEERKSLFNYPDHEEFMGDLGKKLNASFIKKYLLSASLVIGLYCVHVTGKDAIIHEQSNIINTYYILDYLASDLNLDGILEFNTSILKYTYEYSKPTDNPYYNKSNIFYSLGNELRIADNISFIIAMEQLGFDIIDIDDVLYSKTGKITKISYEENGLNFVKYTSRVFTDDEELMEYLNSVSINKPYNRIFSNILTETFDSNSLEDIPSIAKNKETGNITINNPINSTQVKLAKKILADK